MWKKYVGAVHATGSNILRHMRFTCCVTNTTNTHSEYLILTAFSMATMVRRGNLSVSLYVHLSPLLLETNHGAA
jgi:hypothetical protein